ncbi:hypothetical protein Sked_35360 [Sanguibacter keddieii DSM 10542]|uniref:Septum formation-related domain-containing protein n=1 Tax=Sanguibacter keddieii (strain ATCC 51767 / DSM 10542 / NCFB 3025 / ST-74) TaxID=446469 RepID=D1BFC1_SANKS|nr:hypothetical protein Sked_35360 [Sanguibacter keddieii DSM 10542]
MPGQPAWGGQPTPPDPQQTQQWGQQPGQQGHPQQPGQWAPPGEPQAPWAQQGQQGQQGQQPTPGYGQPGGATGQHQGQQWGQQWGQPGQPTQPQHGYPGQQGQPYQQGQQWQQPGQQGQQGQQWGPPAPTKKGSRGLLVGILVAVVVVALGVTAFFVFFAGSDPEALEPDVSSSTQATVGQLVVGNCLEDISGSGSVGDVSVVPCADDHTSQVIGSTTFTDGDFPGQPTLVAQTTAACTPDLVTSGDVPAEDLALVVWTPSETSWSGGDRVGLCIATVDGSTTGSLVD